MLSLLGGTAAWLAVPAPCRLAPSSPRPRGCRASPLRFSRDLLRDVADAPALHGAGERANERSAGRGRAADAGRRLPVAGPAAVLADAPIARVTESRARVARAKIPRGEHHEGFPFALRISNLRERIQP